VFTLRSIPTGQLVITFSGREDWIWNIERELWDHTLQVDYNRYLLPRRNSPGWFLNHSCEPNCVLAGRTAVRSWRPIMKGEEITIDYSTNVGWNGFAMKCLCGTRGCRKVISSYDFLTPEIKRKYGRNVSPYLLGGIEVNGLGSLRKAARVSLLGVGLV
jgi:SET domain-containing protein